jgi:hypothetical protein
LTLASWLTATFPRWQGVALLFTWHEAAMAEHDALKAAREQQQYWEAQYIDAQGSSHLERILLCRNFVDQCELIVAALIEAGDAKPRP